MTADIKEIRPGVRDEVTTEIIPPKQILGYALEEETIERVIVIATHFGENDVVIAGSHDLFDTYAHLSLALRQCERRILKTGEFAP